MLAVVFSGKSSRQIDGSAVVVAPGVAIAAKHVFLPRLEALVAGSQSMNCFGLIGETAQLWNVGKVTLVPNSDLVLLGMSLVSAIPSSKRFYQAVLRVDVPDPGERVTVFGFRSEMPEYVRQKGLHTFEGNVLMSSGQVTQSFPNGRDRVMLPWPVFEVSCASWGGMSGGPVFDGEGRLLGVLASSFTSADGQGPSYVSMLGPTLTTEFEGGWPESIYGTRSTLRSLGEGFCKLVKRTEGLNN